jgi:vancomycin resistance protein VanJ
MKLRRYFVLAVWHILAACAWALGFAVCLWYIMRWLPNGNIGLVMLGDVLSPWLLLVLAPALVLAVVARRRYVSLLLAIATVLVGSILAPLFLPHWSSASSHRLSLKAMSFNLWYNNPYADWPAVAALIRQEHPDVLLLQEIDARMLDQLAAELKDLYSDTTLHVSADAASLQAVISRYPLQLIGAESDRSRLQKVQVKTPAGPIIVWNIHAYRANFLPGANFLSYGADTENHLKYAGQFAWLIDDLQQVHEPFIIGGDFNVPYQSADYRALTQHWQETHGQAGWGFGFTFPATPNHARYASFLGQTIRLSSPLPLVKLDHIFYSAHFFAQAARTLSSSAGSDHAPIVAELFLR